jgi:hypothetical protein
MLKSVSGSIFREHRRPDALGAMMARFAEQWLVQGSRFHEAVEQVTRLWGNVLGLAPEMPEANRV